MGSTWMGLSRVGRGCCSFKYCKIPEAVKQGYHYILLGQKKQQQKTFCYAENLVPCSSHACSRPEIWAGKNTHSTIIPPCNRCICTSYQLTDPLVTRLIDSCWRRGGSNPVRSCVQMLSVIISV